MQIVVYKQPPVLSSPNTSPDKLDFSKLLHEDARRKGTSCDRRRVCKLAESAVSGSNRGTAPQGSWIAEKNISLARSETDIGARLMLWNEKKDGDKETLIGRCIAQICVLIAPIRLIIKKIIVKKLRHRKLVERTPIFLRGAPRSASPIHKAADLT